MTHDTLKAVLDETLDELGRLYPNKWYLLAISGVRHLIDDTLFVDYLLAALRKKVPAL